MSVQSPVKKRLTFTCVPEPDMGAGVCGCAGRSGRDGDVKGGFFLGNSEQTD